jgi:hypothetical protein
VEVLIAVVILGTAAAALLGALGSGIFSSGVHRQQTDAGTVLASVGESLLDPNRNPYVNCAATTGSYDPTNSVIFPTLAWKPLVLITSVSVWNGTSFVTSAPGCADVTTDGLYHLQRIRIKVSNPSGQTTQSRTFFKRGP